MCQHSHANSGRLNSHGFCLPRSSPLTNQMPFWSLFFLWLSSACSHTFRQRYSSKKCCQNSAGSRFGEKFGLFVLLFSLESLTMGQSKAAGRVSLRREVLLPQVPSLSVCHAENTRKVDKFYGPKYGQDYLLKINSGCQLGSEVQCWRPDEGV